MKAVVLFSGGLDSTVLAHNFGRGKRASFTFHYGQRHRKELDNASELAKKMRIPHRILEFPELGSLLGGSSLTDNSIDLPEGHYAEESMKATIVPNRNMILLLWQLGMPCPSGLIPWPMPLMPEIIRFIRIAVPNSLLRWKRLLSLADWQDLKTASSLRRKTKADLVKIGHDLKAPLGDTWSCYAGRDLHCGKCGTLR